MPAWGTRIELLLGGTWTDITGDVLLRDRIRITRGRQSLGARVDPGSCTLTINNKSGKYSDRNPMSPLYGLIGRNTPVRVSAVGGTPWLNLPASGPARVRATTPDASALDITGDLDVRFDVQPADWNAAGVVELGGKWGAAGQRSWQMIIYGGGVWFFWTADGTTELSNSVPLSGAALMPRICLRATLDVNNGASGKTVTFYIGPSLAGPWTQLGTPQISAGTSAVFNSTAPLEVGDITVRNYTDEGCRVYAAEIRNGIGGTVVANPDFTAQTPAATAFTDAAGRAWTVTAGGLSNRHTRFVGEIRAWPVKWDVSGGDVYVQAQAAGIKQRLDRRTAPLDSAMRGTVAAASPLAYWPMEDGAGATQAASGLVGGQPLRVIGGRPRFGAAAGPAGSLALPDFSNGGTLHGTIAGAAAASWTVDCLVKFPTSLPEGFAAAVSWTAAGTKANVWEVDAQPVADGGLSVQWADTAFANFGGPYYSNVSVTDGAWHHVRTTVAQSGSAISIQMWLDGVRVVNASEPSVTLGAITSVDVNGGAAADAGVPSLGHLAVWSPSTTAATYLAADGHNGDPAAARLARVCAEQGVPLLLPYGSSSVQVGPQTTDTFMTLLEAAAATDMGVLYEGREDVTLTYRTRESLYNQAPALTLDYTAKGMTDLTPVPDDTATQNDVTVSRPDGSSARVVLTTGALSVQAPPDGVGAYPVSTTLAAYSDGQLPDFASWLLHLGTWDEARYPSVTLNLAANPSLMAAAATVDVGDLITVSNPPPWLPPDDIRLICQGYTEVLGVYEWTITYNCTPGGPWTVGVVGDTVLGRADTSGSTLATGVTASDVTLSIAYTGARWTTDPTEYPMDLLLGGEVVTATACTGTSSPQSMTVTRGANGVSRAWDAGTQVRLAHPMTLAL